jgi:hypothetical protein
MMHGRTGLVTFPRERAENLHIYCYSSRTGFATRAGRFCEHQSRKSQQGRLRVAQLSSHQQQSRNEIYS